MRDLVGKTAFVTGGASGIGLAIGRAFEAFGKVHVVCNNAGVTGSAGTDNILLQDWQWVIDINLMEVVHGVKAFLPLLKAHGEGGHIVNAASMAGFLRLRRVHCEQIRSSGDFRRTMRVDPTRKTLTPVRLGPVLPRPVLGVSLRPQAKSS
jgi:NAD(P)-dependent dehydrogenase (short-subunit alcohol dehydrogenase family)